MFYFMIPLMIYETYMMSRVLARTELKLENLCIETKLHTLLDVGVCVCVEPIIINASK